MTVSECISAADKMRPNNIAAADKYKFCSTAEQMVQKQIMLLPHRMCVEYQYQNATKNDANVELLAPAPWDMLYVYHVALMIDFTLEDYDKYNNDLSMYNTTFNEYMAYFAQKYRPADGGKYPFVPVYEIIQGESGTITLTELPEELSEYDFEIKQNVSVIHYDETGDEIDYDSETNSMIINISAEDSATLVTTALGIVSLSVKDADGYIYKTSPIGKIRVVS